MRTPLPASPELWEIPVTTRVEQVRRAVLQGILSGAIRPGARLIEAALAGQLGVSQATVNQALQDLHAQGLVHKALNRGTTVRRFGPAELEALFAVRAVLESMAAQEVARRGERRALEELGRWVQQMRTAATALDLARFYLADYEFHQALYRLTGNPFLLQACQAVASAPFAYILCDRPRPLPVDYGEIAEDHQEVIEALRAGPHQALRLMRAKLEKWLKWQREFLSERP